MAHCIDQHRRFFAKTSRGLCTHYHNDYVRVSSGVADHILENHGVEAHRKQDLSSYTETVGLVFQERGSMLGNRSPEGRKKNRREVR